MKQSSSVVHTLAYRPDIDGLRAIAVIAVLFFHAFPRLFPGGFVGVDIFFVISGYLISSILYATLEQNTFSLLDFYARRIRRIFPALIVVLAAGYLFGWFYLFVDEFAKLGSHTFASAGFIQNWLLASESGYFDSSADLKPYLHLWSLGVEEQFYIVWPIFLWLAWKLRINLLAATFALGLASFAWNIYSIYFLQSTIAFYMPQVRFWELLIGGGLAYVSFQKRRTRAAISNQDLGINNKHQVASLLGIALLALSFILISSARPYPGWWALLPTLGATLLIFSGPSAWLNRRILSNRVLVWLGQISYPLYLWHWIILAFLRITQDDIVSSGKARLLILVLSVGLAWLTNLVIEKPLRYGRYLKIKTCGLLLVMILIGVVGYQTEQLGGIGFRFEDSKHYLGPDFQAQMMKNVNAYYKYSEACDFYQAETKTTIPKDHLDKKCLSANAELPNKNIHTVFLWGDSHAQMLTYGLEKNLSNDWRLMQVASSGCLPNPSQLEDSQEKYCERSNFIALKMIQEVRPEVVVLAQSIKWNKEKIDDLVLKLSTFGVKKIIFVGQSPEWSDALPTLLLRKQVAGIPRYTNTGLIKSVMQENQEIRSTLFKKSLVKNVTVEFIDVMETFCTTDGCLVYIGDDVKTGITYFDSHHLSPIASDYLAKDSLIQAITGKN